MAPTPYRRFAGQTVLITGASRGLGRTMAVGFAEEGAHVVVGYLSRETEAEKTLALMKEVGGQGEKLAFDVTDVSQVNSAIDDVLHRLGAIDVLVNNAGIANDEFFAMMTKETWDSVIRTNVDGLFHCSRAVVRSMIAKKKGVIVNVGAISALRASPGQVNYAASKGALVAFTKALSAELAPRGIRVNAVLPGAIASGLFSRIDKRVADRVRAAIPLGRFGTADEVARAVLFLASDESAYVVGHALVVDGGLSA